MLNRTLPLAASIVVACGAVALADDVQVTASALNVRSGPSSGYRVLGSVARGTRLLRLGSSGSWTKVRYRGMTGYVYTRYTTRITYNGNNGSSNTNTAVTRYATANLNVRSGPSTAHRRVGSLAYGQAVSVRGQSGQWSLITYAGQNAYVHNNYLTGNRPSGGNSGGNTSTGTTRYSTANLNVRSGPSTRYRRVGSLSYGQAVSVRGQSGDWSLITYAGQDAYVHSSYLTSSRPSTGGGNSGGYASNGPRSRAGFIQLANSGPGFYGYYASSKRWGRPALVYGIERAARRFKAANPSAPRLGVGDISLQNGGDIAGHASHERGVDADFRPIRNDGQEGRTTRFQSNYSRTYTNRVIQLIRSETRVHLIFFNDLNISGVQRWPNHDNHFHVRIR